VKIDLEINPRTNKEDHMAKATPGSDYNVQKGGERLTDIAQSAYNDQGQWKVIASANGLDTNPATALNHVVPEGQVLYIPVIPASTKTKPKPGFFYSVQKNDTLASIAKNAYNDSNKAKAIADDNKLEDAPVTSGMKLFIPVLVSATPQQSFYYMTVLGDNLTKIAHTAYGKDNWQPIYNYPPNKRKIGSDPNLIQDKVLLFIPPVS
jgi:nucleoid-associated protein YgaU